MNTSSDPPSPPTSVYVDPRVLLWIQNAFMHEFCFDEEFPGLGGTAPMATSAAIVASSSNNLGALPQQSFNTPPRLPQQPRAASSPSNANNASIGSVRRSSSSPLRGRLQTIRMFSRSRSRAEPTGDTRNNDDEIPADDTRNNDDGYSPEPENMSRMQTIAWIAGRQARKGLHQGAKTAAKTHASTIAGKFEPAANRISFAATRISWAFMIIAVGFMIIALAYAYSAVFR